MLQPDEHSPTEGEAVMAEGDARDQGQAPGPNPVLKSLARTESYADGLPSSGWTAASTVTPFFDAPVPEDD